MVGDKFPPPPKKGITAGLEAVVAACCLALDI
jgi:hypothetical protein